MAAFFGFHNPNYTFAGVSDDKLFDRVVHNARAAENAGFDLFTVMDHLYQIRGVGPETEPMLEAYTTLAAVAAQTSRINVSAMVTGVTYRNPALLAKQVTTLDIISNGRAMFGIGAAWNRDEHLGYGYEFPPSATAWIDSRRRCRSQGSCSPRIGPRSPASTTGSNAR